LTHPIQHKKFLRSENIGESNAEYDLQTSACIHAAKAAENTRIGTIEKTADEETPLWQLQRPSPPLPPKYLPPLLHFMALLLK